MPQVSIVVPVYNAEKTLDKCIKSIIAQSYRDFELLLIDDGSSDSSGSICDAYMDTDDRVKVYHKVNGGVSSARNMGIDNVSGEWILFVDSDDWLGESLLQNLMEMSNCADLVVSYPILVFSDKTSFAPQFPSRFYDESSFQDIFIYNALHEYTSPWAKLFKKEIIRNEQIRFCEDMFIGEDMVFLYTYMKYVKSIYVSTSTDYFYNFESQSSLTKRVNTFSSEYSGYSKILNTIEALIDIWSISNTCVLDKLRWLQGNYVRRVLNSMYHSDMSVSHRLEVLRAMDLEAYYNYLHIPALKEKLLAYLLKYKLFILYDITRTIASIINRVSK